MKVGDLARLSTPDDDDNKVALITDIRGSADKPTSFYVAVIVGETEQRAYLLRELKRL